MALYLSVIYIQSIGSGIGIFSGLFISSLVPIKPSEGKPSRCLTKLERQQLTIPENLKEIVVGLLLGDLKRPGLISHPFDRRDGLLTPDVVNLTSLTEVKLTYSKLISY